MKTEDKEQEERKKRRAETRREGKRREETRREEKGRGGEGRRGEERDSAGIIAHDAADSHEAAATGARIAQHHRAFPDAKQLNAPTLAPSWCSATTDSRWAADTRERYGGHTLLPSATSASTQRCSRSRY